METNRDQLEQLLLCISARLELAELVATDPRFGTRLQQTIRGCLGGTTQDSEDFMEQVFGKDPMDRYREARRGAQGQPRPAIDGGADRRPEPLDHEH